jgi:hypothetical protein
MKVPTYESDASIGDALIQWLVENLPEKSTILELGSGEGTKRLLEYGWSVHSIEHDPMFCRVIPYHKYILAPLTPHKPIQNYPSLNEWYDREPLHEYNTQGNWYDLLLIDGPPSPNRVGLIKYWDLFNPNVPWVFDDLNRKPEMHLIHGISARIGRPYTVFNAYGHGKDFGVIYGAD